jgi:putative transcriptional regulator
MIKIHLSRLLGEKRWTQSDLAKKTGIRPSTINEMYHEIIERINLDYLDLICEALGCEVSDLLEYIPNKQRHTRKYIVKENRK